MSSSPLKLVGHIPLPPHRAKGGFDHAAAHAASGHIYVAHTANDAVDVVDAGTGQYAFSVPDLAGVAGVLVSDQSQLIITSNRAENTIGIFKPGRAPSVEKVAVGVRPNGLAFDERRGLILAANVGDPAVPGSYTLSMVDLAARKVRVEIPVAGRTRWALYDPDADAFYVNIQQPPQIAVVHARNPDRIAHLFDVPAAGPHGLDMDRATRRLFCACDAGTLVALDANSGRILDQQPLSGVPDVIWFNPSRSQVYVAIGDPGVIDVFDTRTMKSLGSVATEPGAHTTALAPSGDRIFAFLPATHRAAGYYIRR